MQGNKRRYVDDRDNRAFDDAEAFLQKFDPSYYSNTKGNDEYPYHSVRQQRRLKEREVLVAHAYGLEQNLLKTGYRLENRRKKRLD